MKKGKSEAEKKQESRELARNCWMFLRPFAAELHKRVDRRLVKTLLDLATVILMHRQLPRLCQTLADRDIPVLHQS